MNLMGYNVFNTPWSGRGRYYAFLLLFLNYSMVIFSLLLISGAIYPYFRYYLYNLCKVYFHEYSDDNTNGGEKRMSPPSTFRTVNTTATMNSSSSSATIAFLSRAGGGGPPSYPPSFPPYPPSSAFFSKLSEETLHATNTTMEPESGRGIASFFHPSIIRTGIRMVHRVEKEEGEGGDGSTRNPNLQFQKTLPSVSIVYLLYCTVGAAFFSILVLINFFKTAFTCPGYVPRKVWRYPPVMLPATAEGGGGGGGDNAVAQIHVDVVGATASSSTSMGDKGGIAGDGDGGGGGAFSFAPHAFSATRTREVSESCDCISSSSPGALAVVPSSFSSQPPLLTGMDETNKTKEERNVNWKRTDMEEEEFGKNWRNHHHNSNNHNAYSDDAKREDGEPDPCWRGQGTFMLHRSPLGVLPSLLPLPITNTTAPTISTTITANTTNSSFAHSSSSYGGVYRGAVIARGNDSARPLVCPLPISGGVVVAAAVAAPSSSSASSGGDEGGASPSLSFSSFSSSLRSETPVMGTPAGHYYKRHDSIDREEGGRGASACSRGSRAVDNVKGSHHQQEHHRHHSSNFPHSPSPAYTNIHWELSITSKEEEQQEQEEKEEEMNSTRDRPAGSLPSPPPRSPVSLPSLPSALPSNFSTHGGGVMPPIEKGVVMAVLQRQEREGDEEKTDDGNSGGGKFIHPPYWGTSLSSRDNVDDFVVAHRHHHHHHGTNNHHYPAAVRENPYTVHLTQEGFARFCMYCNQYKPDRAYHCRRCRQCVFFMDHHCPFVNNCVGRDNTKYFLLFTLYIPIGALHMLITMMYSFFWRREEHLIFLTPSSNPFTSVGGGGGGVVGVVDHHYNDGFAYLNTSTTPAVVSSDNISNRTSSSSIFSSVWMWYWEVLGLYLACAILFGGFTVHFWCLLWWRGESSISKMISRHTKSKRRRKENKTLPFGVKNEEQKEEEVDGDTPAPPPYMKEENKRKEWKEWRMVDESRENEERYEEENEEKREGKRRVGQTTDAIEVFPVGSSFSSLSSSSSSPVVSAPPLSSSSSAYAPKQKNRDELEKEQEEEDEEEEDKEEEEDERRRRLFLTTAPSPPSPIRRLQEKMLFLSAFPSNIIRRVFLFSDDGESLRNTSTKSGLSNATVLFGGGASSTALLHASLTHRHPNRRRRRLEGGGIEGEGGGRGGGGDYDKDADDEAVVVMGKMHQPQPSHRTPPIPGQRHCAQPHPPPFHHMKEEREGMNVPSTEPTACPPPAGERLTTTTTATASLSSSSPSPPSPPSALSPPLLHHQQQQTNAIDWFETYEAILGVDRRWWVLLLPFAPVRSLALYMDKREYGEEMATLHSMSRKRGWGNGDNDDEEEMMDEEDLNEEWADLGKGHFGLGV